MPKLNLNTVGLRNKHLNIAVIGPDMLCHAFSALLTTFDKVVVVPMKSATLQRNYFESQETDLWLLLGKDASIFARDLFQGVSSYPKGFVLIVLLNSLAPPDHEMESVPFYIRQDEIETMIRTAGNVGVRTFVSVDDTPQVLQKALIATSINEPFCSPALVPYLVRALGRLETQGLQKTLSTCNFFSNGPAAHWGLTEREREVASYAAQGLSNVEISVNLFLSVNTVKSHLKQIFRKGRLTSRSQLASLWAAIPSPGTLVLSKGSAEMLTPKRDV